MDASSSMNRNAFSVPDLISIFFPYTAHQGQCKVDFYPFEFAGHGDETQLQAGEN